VRGGLAHGAGQPLHGVCERGDRDLTVAAVAMPAIAVLAVVVIASWFSWPELSSSWKTSMERRMFSRWRPVRLHGRVEGQRRCRTTAAGRSGA